MLPLPLLERQPAWAVWSAGFCLAGLFTYLAYSMIILPAEERETENQALTEQIAQQSADAKALRHELAQLNHKLNQVKTSLEEQPIELGDQQNLNRQIAELIALAQQHRLEVLQLQPGEPVPGEDYTLIPLQLRANATFAEHLNFLQAVHVNFPSISVVGLDLESRTRTDAPRPRATFALAWFTEAGNTTLALGQPGR